MVTQKDVQKLEHASVKLTITVDGAEAQKKYDELLKKYAKTAHIKGFRKGKVPPKILEQKYGEGIKEEATIEILDEGLKEALEDVEQKPLPYAQPRLDDEESLNLTLGEDFTFSVIYDVYPDIEVGEYKGLEIEVPDVKVLKKDEKRELENIQEQNSMVAEKQGGAVEKDDIVTIDYVELDEEGNEKPDTSRSDFVFTVGTGYNIFKIDDDIIGMQKDEEKVIEKEFPEDFEHEEYAGKKIRLKVKVKTIKQKDVPALDDELAQDVSDEYETLDDLKKSVRAQLEETLNQKLRETKIEKLFDQIIENSKIDPPESMIQAELDNSWQRFIQQSRIGEEQVLQILQMQGKSKEDMLAEWRPNAERSLKFQLLVEKIRETEGIEATDEEAYEELKQQAEQAGQDYEEVKQQYEQNNLMDYVKTDVQNRKLFDFLLEQSKLKKGKKMDYLDFVQNNN
ncbi:MAG: trigger factor [Spirochaetaceae bacterium]|nr:trigger factor [Spirochaetaceae bacterium]MCF7947706.1 trigger factor [Spirochaetia bacterium]MCF7950533.1 trigger factor [Spirochaetaceae bacterium]